jgi:nucleoside-diphosphate-sugar epimerase
MAESSFLAGKKILITGGTGHLGSALIHHLAHGLGHDPSAIRVFYLARTPIQSLRDIPGLDFRPGNVLSFEDILGAAEGVDYVFHLAGLTTFDPRLKALQWRVNVEGTRHVLEACRRSSSVRRLCFTSTVDVLGVPDPPGGIGSFENSDPYKNQPRLHSFQSPAEILDFATEVRLGCLQGWEKRIRFGYFDSKLAAQELVHQYAREFGLDVVSALPGTVFGPYDFLIGNGIYLLRIFRRRMPGVLKGGISAMHVMDAAEGHLLVMEKARQGSRYIITGAKEDHLSLSQMTTIMSEVLKRRFPRKKIRPPAAVFPVWAADIAAYISETLAGAAHRPCALSRAAVRAGSMPLYYTYEDTARDLGYKPKRTFLQAIEEMVDYYQAENLFEAKGRFVDRLENGQFFG